MLAFSDQADSVDETLPNIVLQDPTLALLAFIALHYRFRSSEFLLEITLPVISQVLDMMIKYDAPSLKPSIIALLQDFIPLDPKGCYVLGIKYDYLDIANQAMKSLPADFALEYFSPEELRSLPATAIRQLVKFLRRNKEEDPAKLRSVTQRSFDLQGAILKERKMGRDQVTNMNKHGYVKRSRSNNNRERTRLSRVVEPRISDSGRKMPYAYSR